jgi:putative transposase
LYYSPAGESPENLGLMKMIDEQYTKTPFYGSRKMREFLVRQGYEVNRKRIQRLMRLMGIQAIYPKRNLSRKHPESRVYPYLLRGMHIAAPDQVWSTDITYIPMLCGFIYLTAIIDWYSRFVLAWQLSNSLDTHFCIWALEDALATGRKPDIFNSDQGPQYTSTDFTDVLKAHAIQISMDGRGRAYDNIFIERLWRSVKYEEVYLKDYVAVPEVYDGLGSYFSLFNNERPHQALGYLTPAEVYIAGRTAPGIVVK